MSERFGFLKDELARLRTLRDELRVQLDLGQMELRDRFESAEKQWHQLEGKLGVIERESKEALDDVKDAAKNLVDEIGEAYKHIRSKL